MGVSDDSRPDARGRALSAAAAVAGAVALWWFVAWVFSSDRGLDLTDEGLYLLALDPPSKVAGWVTPFGWSTSPLFDVVGHDVARTRTLAVVVLVVVGGAMGWATARWAGRDDRTARWAFAAIGALGAPLLTASFLRTPGYNWANLVGLMVGVTGIMLAARSSRFGPAILALGVVVAVPAKATSGIALLLVATLVWWTTRGRDATIRSLGLTAVWGVGWVALAIITGRWPTSFLSVLWDSTSFPPLHENQDLSGAFHDLLRTPKVAWQQLGELRPAALALVAVATVLAVVVRRRPEWHWTVRCLPFALVAVAAVGTAVPWPALGLPNPAFRFAWFGTTNAALLLLFGAFLHLVANWQAVDRASARRGLVATLAMGVLVVAFGFGSAMSIYNQAALAVVLVVVAAAVVVTAVREPAARDAALAMLALSTLALVVSNVVDSRHHPYRNVDVAFQSTPVTIGAHESELLVEPSMAAALTELRTEARRNGFCDGDLLIGLRWGWSSTEPFALGAHVPDSLMLTIFGYPEASTLLPVTMARMDGPEWHDAWVMTTDVSTIEAAQAAELRAALDRLPDTVGRTFPDDYTLEVDLDGTQLWRPTEVRRSICG